MRRIVSLWLPRFATDRPTRPGAPLSNWRERPFATVGTGKGGLRIVAANAAAEAAGVFPALPAADARAICPALKTAEAAPEDDLRALVALADWCGRFSPWTSPEGLSEDGGGGVWLDSTGCDHLFGGEAAMLDDILAAMARLGLEARAGLADTPGAAWAAARFATDTAKRAEIVPPGAARQLLSGLPVAALRLSPAASETLHRLGVRHIGDLLALPRAPLAARFGQEATRRLDQFLGLASEPISPRRPVPPYHARMAFAEPIGRIEDIAAALDRLLAALCRRLEKDGKGARRLDLMLYRVDGTHERVAVGTARPVRRPAHLARLFAEKLKAVQAGFGIEAITLAVPVAEGLSAAQMDLTRPRGDGGQDRLELLIDRLENRLGRGRLVRPASRASHVPERAVRAAPPLAGAGEEARWPVGPRPPRLLRRPEAIGAQAPDGMPPRRFLWRGRMHEVARCDGPERIAAPWWHGAEPTPYESARDYWRIEDSAGRRYWLFRDGGGWFVHGIFA